MELRNQIENLIEGSILLGTGGGGRPEEARAILNRLASEGRLPPVRTLGEFPPNALFVTAFAVGSVASSSKSEEPIRIAFERLASELGRPIQGVIPVEIGPKSIATACFLASVANVPLLDADIVGGRSTPEVFLETITLFGFKRTPAVVVNDSGDLGMLLTSSSPAREEAFFRTFSSGKEGQAYVVGYPLTLAQVQEAIETGTVSDSVKAGELLRSQGLEKFCAEFNAKEIVSGTITAIQEFDQSGFLQQVIEIEGSKKEQARVFVKNENLIVWVNDAVALSCPDSVLMVDEDGRAIYNADLQVWRQVSVLGLAARPRWRTAKGVELFNPRTFGIDCEVSLMR